MKLETRRLRLVLQTRADIERMIEAMSADEKSQVSADWLTRMRAADEGNPWLRGFNIVQVDGDSVIGNCAYKGPPVDGIVEIAYGIDPEHRGQGYATEAAQALFDFASSRDDVRLVVAHTLPDGVASKRVLTKCGFRYIGETVDPEDGTVSRFERAAGSQAGAK